MHLYVDGVAHGDPAKLEQAFHADARMFGSIGGQRVDIPISTLFDMAVAAPRDTSNYEASLVVADQVGDAATAKLEESGCWGTTSFVDFFSLSRFDDGWKLLAGQRHVAPGVRERLVDEG